MSASLYICAKTYTVSLFTYLKYVCCEKVEQFVSNTCLLVVSQHQCKELPYHKDTTVCLVFVSKLNIVHLDSLEMKV